MSRERKVSIICHSIALAIVIAMMIFLCFKNSDGVYYDLAIDQAIGNANNWFGIFFVIVGEYPQYILIPIAGTIFFYNADSFKEKYKQIIFKIFACIVVAAGFFIWVNNGTKVSEVPAKPLFAVFAMLFYGAICLGVGSLVAKAEMKRLFKLAIFLLTFVVVSYLVMTIIKNIWCRMRFRDMLKEGSFDGFTPWYKPMIGREKTVGYDYTSFPSGHTSSAVHIFVITLLPIYFKKLDKQWIRYTLYGFSVAFVILVAISRVVNTAHFLSDTIMGGSITYAIFYGLKRLFFKNGYVFEKKEIIDGSIQE